MVNKFSVSSGNQNHIRNAHCTCMYNTNPTKDAIQMVLLAYLHE